MKITQVETVLLSSPPSRPVRWSGGEISIVQASLIQIHTDENVTGLGEPYLGILAPEAVRGIVESLEPLLLGEDPTRISFLLHKMQSLTFFWARVGAGMSVIGALETALWDILGKVRGLPVYELLGGKVHEKLPLYASGGLEKPFEEITEEMHRYQARGLKAVKVRIGMGLKRDVKKLETVRQAVGLDFTIMVDAVQGHNPQPWTAKEAIQVGKALEPLNIAWFEEPCGATDYEGYARVRDNISIPIAGGESTTSLADFKRFFDAASLDIAQPDTAHSGGVIECQKIAALAQSYGVGVALHSWASAVTLAPNYHLALATPNCRILEYPTWGYPLIEELFVDPLRIEDGFVYPPEAPGLGVELTDEIRAKYAFRKGLGATMRKHQ
jgi:L-alanine-DL-glutamate epimerase-like enolase superfamily enzyme